MTASDPNPTRASDLPEAARSAAPPSPAGPIVATAGSYYRNTHYILCFVLVVFGVLCIRDGFFRWPYWPETHPLEMPKTHADILINQVLGCVLPPLGILLLVRTLYRSRGEIRLENEIVHVPGHQPIPLTAIQAVDRSKWDRKGIAIVEYSSPEAPGKIGKFKLDDFVYERPPTDEIFKRIEASLLSESAPPGEATSSLPPL